MNIFTRIFSSNPFTFALGMGAGLVGLYMINKTDEKKKMAKMLNEMEESIKIMEMRQNALIETSAEVAKAS